MVRSEADRFKELYDVEKHVMAIDGGILVEDPYPAFAELRAQAAGAPGLGARPARLPAGRAQPPPRGARRTPRSPSTPTTRVLRENEVFSSEFYAGFTTRDVRPQHSRDGGRRAPPQPRARAAGVLAEAIAVVDRSVDHVARRRGRVGLRGTRSRGAERRALRAHPPPDDHGELRSHAARRRSTSVRTQPRAEATTPTWTTGAARFERTTAMLRHVIEERRADPQDDVITMLVESELEEDGERHLLTDDEIYGFARLILTAGSGTTWRQLGILLVALLLGPAAARRGARRTGELLRRAIDEAVRWEPTDPIFRRLVTEDVELCGVEIPAGAVVEMALGAANRDPDALGRSRAVRSVPRPEAEPRVRGRAARVPGHARGASRDARRHERGARPAPERAPRSRCARRRGSSGSSTAGPTASPSCSE